MSLQRKIKVRTHRRALRVRSRLTTGGDRLRVSVNQSLRHMYAQIIDDAQQTTLASCSSLQLTSVKGDKKAVAKAIGQELAQRALDKGIKKVVFDRGSFSYHGRIRALAEGLREGGLEF